MLKKTLKWVWGIVEVIVIVYVIFMTAYILCRNKYGFTQIDKYTFVTLNEENSKFIPEFDEGDLLIVRSKKYGIEEGSVIYYYVTVNEEYVVRSGIVKSKTEDEYSSLYYLNDEDGTSVSSNRVLGKDVAVYPGKGSILEFLEGRIGFLLCVLLPIMIIFIYRIYDLFVVSKYRHDDEEEDEDEVSSKEVVEAPSKQNQESTTVKEMVVETSPVIPQNNSIDVNVATPPVVEESKIDINSFEEVSQNNPVVGEKETSVEVENKEHGLTDQIVHSSEVVSNDVLNSDQVITHSDQATIENREIKPVFIPPVVGEEKEEEKVDTDVEVETDVVFQAIPSVKEEDIPQIINTIPADSKFIEDEEETEIL